MLLTSLSLTAWIVLLTLSTARAKPPAALPYTLCWGASSVTASRLTPTEEFQAVTFPTSNEYQAYVDDALVHYGTPASHDKPDDDYATAVFQKDVRTASRMLRIPDGEDPKFSMFILPTIFNDSSSSAAQTAVLPVAKIAGESYPALTRHLASIACYAYHLQSCEHNGRTRKECQDKLGELNDVALVIKYEKQYLGLHIVSLAYELGTLPHMRTRISPRFGEKNANALWKDRSYGPYAQALREFITDFIESGRNLPSDRYGRHNVRAIVATGSASSTSFAEVLGMARDVIGHQEIRTFDSIDPETVVAKGAAMWGVWSNLEYIRSWDGHSHDEL